jgi:hypothetical protein
MPTSPKLGTPYPSGSDPNDFAAALAAMANGPLDDAARYRDGNYSTRGSAGSHKGEFFNALDTTINGGLYWSTGSVWKRVSPSPWVTWTPNIGTTNGGGGSSPVQVAWGYGPFGAWRYINDSTVEIAIDGGLKLYGASQQFCGIIFTPPVAAARYYVMKAEAMNDLCRGIMADGAPSGVAGFIAGQNALFIYPHGGYNASGHQFDGSVYIGQWLVDNFARGVTVSGTYPIA